MGPFMVEIVFCRVTRRGRKLKKGMNKAGLANTRNDGPSQSFIPPDDTVKITLDLSENGPVFNALDEMMMKMLEDESDTKKTKKKGGGSAGPGGAEAKKALKSLLKSGIPGIEKMFAPAGKGKKGSAKGFHRMNEGSKKKFMKAIFGEDGTAISTGTAAALIAATCSGGDPEVGDKIAQLLVPELGNKIDPTMMAALMISCSMISAGAGMEEVLKAMKAELLDSGMPEEEIFRKTQLLMQAFGRDESGSLAEYSLVGKQKNSALKKISISPKDFSQIALLQRTLGACGATPENLAKVIMIQNQLSKRGAQSRHIADALRKLTDPNKGKKDTIDLLSKSLNDPKMKKEDVQITVRMMQAIDMENDATWKEVKSMKEILTGASPTSPEAIELNLARATKAAGLNRGELTRVLLAQRTMSTLGVDPTLLSQVLNIEKVIADNGVPAVEIARVLTDGGVPKEAHAKLVEMTLAGLQKEYCAADVEAFIKLYDGLKLKSNVPEETIEHIDKTLIQVRCSLEDVADNTVSSMCARGEKDSVIVRNLCETLKDTGASVQIVGTTMMGSLVKVLPKPEPEIMKDTGRTLTEVGYNTDDVNSTMTEILLNVLDEKPQLREEALKAVEVVMKDSGQFPDQIRTYLDSVVPEEVPMDAQLAEELERLRKADARGDGGDGAESDGEPEYDEQGRVIPKIIEPRNRGQGHMDSGSRRGSNVGTSPRGSISIGGTERRGSFYSEDVSKRDSVAIVVDDPHNQNNMKKALDEVFEEESKKTGGSLRVLAAQNASARLEERPDLADSVQASDPLLHIQESLIQTEVEKISQLSGPEADVQLAKVLAMKEGLDSATSIANNKAGPSWKDKLASTLSTNINPSDLSVQDSLELIDKEFEKLSSLPGPEKAKGLKDLQDLKKGLLMDLISTSDSSGKETDSILRILESNQNDIPLRPEQLESSSLGSLKNVKLSTINQQVSSGVRQISKDPESVIFDRFQQPSQGSSGELSDLVRSLSGASGDKTHLSSAQASQILSLVNEVVSSDPSTSSSSNLKVLKSILSSQMSSGDRADISEAELSKVLSTVMGSKTDDFSSTPSLNAEDSHGHTATLPSGKGPLTVDQKTLLAGILKSTDSGIENERISDLGINQSRKILNAALSPGVLHREIVGGNFVESEGSQGIHNAIGGDIHIDESHEGRRVQLGSGGFSRDQSRAEYIFTHDRGESQSLFDPSKDTDINSRNPSLDLPSHEPTRTSFNQAQRSTIGSDVKQRRDINYSRDESAHSRDHATNERSTSFLNQDASVSHSISEEESLWSDNRSSFDPSRRENMRQFIRESTANEPQRSQSHKTNANTEPSIDSFGQEMRRSQGATSNTNPRDENIESRNFGEPESRRMYENSHSRDRDPHSLDKRERFEECEGPMTSSRHLMSPNKNEGERQRMYESTQSRDAYSLDKRDKFRESAGYTTSTRPLTSRQGDEQEHRRVHEKPLSRDSDPYSLNKRDKFAESTRYDTSNTQLVGSQSDNRNTYGSQHTEDYSLNKKGDYGDSGDYNVSDRQLISSHRKMYENPQNQHRDVTFNDKKGDYGDAGGYKASSRPFISAQSDESENRRTYERQHRDSFNKKSDYGDSGGNRISDRRLTDDDRYGVDSRKERGIYDSPRQGGEDHKEQEVRYHRRPRPIMDSNAVLFNSVMRRAKRTGKTA